MPAVTIRQIENLTKVAEFTSTSEQRDALRQQAEMLERSSEEAIPEPDDREEVRRRYDEFLKALECRAVQSGRS
jgi:uncharacterized membrane protein